MSLKLKRLKMDSNEIVSSMQKCYAQSYSSLISTTIRLSIKNFLLIPSNQLAILFTLICSSFVLNFLTKYNLIYSSLVSFTCLPILLIAFISYRSYFDWKKFIKRNIDNTDISHKWASKIYSKNENAMFALTTFNKNNRLECVAMSAILIGEEKNFYRDDHLLSELSENQALLTRVGVLPMCHGRGMGKTVVQACIEFAKLNDVKTIKLTTSSPHSAAICLYKSLGFEITKVKDLIPILGFKKMAMELNLESMI